ncbi:MAG: glycosyltransferase family 2 protein [Flavobacterium sp.]
MEKSKELKISIIIPTLNRYDCIINLLHDIHNQECPVHEVIVSDQSRERRSIDILDFNFVLKHINHPGTGPCCSRNDAAQLASGDIFVFLDDDVRIDKDFIMEIISPIVSKKTSVGTGAICDKEGNYTRELKNYDIFTHKRHWLISFTKNPNHFNSQFSYATPSGCLAIEKKIFLELGGFDTFFDPNGACEDREFAVRLVKKGVGIYYNSKAKLMHLSEPVGGRRSPKNSDTPLSFKKNFSYLLLKHFGASEFSRYKNYEIKVMVRKILSLDNSYSNLVNLVNFLKSIKRLKKLNFKRD